MITLIAVFVFLVAVAVVAHSKWWVVLAYAAVMAAYLVGQGEPTSWIRSGEARVLSVTEDKGTAFYVLVQYPNQTKPVYVKVPWSEQTAAELGEAQATAGRHGKVKLKSKGRAAPPGDSPPGTFEGEDYTPPPKS